MANYPPYEIEGKKWLRGSAGSLILRCPKCGPHQDHFRDPMNYFGTPPTGDKSWHKCFKCRTQMRPVEVTEDSTATTTLEQE
jgi:hypothetical protein